MAKRAKGVDKLHDDTNAAVPHAENPRAQIGGNNPPSQIELMRETHADLATKIGALAERATAAPKEIKTAEDLATITQLVLDTRALSKSEREAFTKEKAPWLEGGRVVDNFFNSLKERLGRIADAMQDRADAYARKKEAEEREAARKAAAAAAAKVVKQEDLAEKHQGSGRAVTHNIRAETAREEAERAGVATNAPAADLVRTRLDSGAVVSAKANWVARITDFSALQKSLGPLGPYFKPADIDKVLGAAAKATQGRVEIPGVVVEKETKSNITKR